MNSILRNLRVSLFFILLTFASGQLFAQNTRTISGTVTDASGEPIIGAAVVCKGADVGTGVITDLDGGYTITVPSDVTQLEASSLGYQTQAQTITGDKVDFKMQDEVSLLEDAVVIGYGTVRKSDLTGSVSVVNTKELETSPAISIDDALQGKVAGVDIMSTSGDPSSSSSIRIRGTRSITASNEPLIIVNGVMDAVSDIKDINPADIESISVLKDASSTAIYGSRGSNGVIIVTTKVGKTDKPKINVNMKAGVSMIARKLDLMNKVDFVNYRNDYLYMEKYIAGVEDITPTYDPSDYPADTDWIGAITRPAPYQNYNFSISGSLQNKFWYYASLGYTNQQGIIKKSGFQRFSANYTATHKFNKWLKVRLAISASYRIENPNNALIGGTNNGNGAVYLPPVLGEMDNHNPLIENSKLINTPVACINLIENTVKKLQNTDALTITLTPVKGLTIESQNSLILFQNHTYKFWPSTMPAKSEGEGADAYRYEADNLGLSTENTITYKATVGNHSFDAMAGFSAIRKKGNMLGARADAMVSDYLKWNNLNAVVSKENYTITSSASSVVRESAYARFNYNYASRYYLTLTARADGSSNFAASHKWAFFPSGAFKWNAKNEKFLKNVRWLSGLELRASYGRTGNDALSSFSALQAYSTTTDSYLFDGNQGASFYPVRVASPNLSWEKTDMGNIAVEASFLRNRIKFCAEAYFSRTSDLLLSVKTIQSTGYASRFENLGVTTNKGVEFTLETRNIERAHFGWTTTITASHNAQMVKNIGQEDYVPLITHPVGYMMYGYKAGYPLNSLWGFEYAGVFKTAEEFDRNEITHTYSGQQVYTRANCLGRPKYVDQDKDGVISAKDLVYLGNADPIVYGGVQNDFYIHNFSISAYLAYSIGGKIYNYSEIYMSGGTTANQYNYMKDAWHPTKNPDSDLPRAGHSQTTLPCTLMVHDASFLRLKNLTFSYRFDIKRKFMDNITLSLSGENLYLLTKYNGFDPDVSTESEDSALRRVDLGAYPKARTIIAGVKIVF